MLLKMMMVMTITRIDGPRDGDGQGKQARRHACTQGHRNADTQERERAGTQARRHAGTQARKHTSTQARGHAGTQARKHTSTQAGRQASRQTRATPTLRKRAKTAPQKIEQSLVQQKGSQPVPGSVEVPALSAVSSPEFTPVRRGPGFKVPQPRTPPCRVTPAWGLGVSPRSSKLPAASPVPHRFTCGFGKSVPAYVISLAFPRAPSCPGVLGCPPSRDVTARPGQGRSDGVFGSPPRQYLTPLPPPGLPKAGFPP